METTINTIQQTYQHPIKTINVPTELEGQGFRVYFEPIVELAKKIEKTDDLSIAGQKHSREMGTLKGKIHVPDDFDHAFSDEIEALFAGENLKGLINQRAGS